MMNWLKKLMLFKLLILLIWLKKADYNTKIVDIEKNTLIMLVLKILLHKSLISCQQIILQQD